MEFGGGQEAIDGMIAAGAARSSADFHIDNLLSRIKSGDEKEESVI
jgi:hypothetical protein